VFWNATGHEKVPFVHVERKHWVRRDTDFSLQRPQTPIRFTHISFPSNPLFVHSFLGISLRLSGQAIHFIERSSPGWSWSEVVRRYVREGGEVHQWGVGDACLALWPLVSAASAILQYVLPATILNRFGLLCDC